MKPRIKLGLIIGFFALLIVLSFAAVHYSGLATRADLSGESAITVPRFMTETSVSPALQPGVDFTFTPTSPTVGLSVTFTASVTGGTPPFSYFWKFSDGVSGSGNPISRAFSLKGTYSVTLNVTDSSSPPLTGSVSHVFTVNPLPLASDFSFSPLSPCVGTTIIFTGSASGGTAPYSFSWSFGDGTAKAVGSTQFHNYVVKGTYTITMNVTDINAFSKNISHTLTASPCSFAVSISGPTTGTVGTPVGFTAAGSGGTVPYVFYWSFGDGTATIVGGNSQSHIYNVKGSYTLNVTLTDANGARTFSGRTIAISPLPLSVAPIVPTTGTVNTPISVSATASGGTAPYTFSWNFGDGTANVAGTPASHAYTVKGTYTVKVNATDHNGVIASASATITISPLPLTVTPTVPTTATVGTSVSVSASASGGTAPYTFSWSFGDGTANVAGTPASHTYTIKGTYTVRVNATDHNSVIASASRAITISPLPLTSDFSPLSACIGTTITFAGSVSGGTAPYSFTWNFGDGTAKVSGNPAFHSYSVKGTYTVTMNVTDFNAATRSITHAFTASGCALVVTPTVPATGTVGTPVSVSAAASGGTSPYFFSWNFGDSTANVAGNTASHTYSVKGTYTVRVNATDISGRIASASSSITVSPLTLTTDFTFSPTIITPGSPVIFTATASGGTVPYLYTWNFGDGSTAVGNSVMHTYLSLGPFTITINVTDANSHLATASHSFSVGPPPLLLADFGPVKSLIGTTTFVSLITGGLPPFTCVWTFGDGTPTTIGCNPDHTYIASGVFTAQVTINDNIGQTASATHPVTVENNPTLFGSRLHWDRKLALGSTETFSAKMTNPSDLNVTATVTIDVFTDDGVFIAHLTASESLAPGAADTNFPLSFVPTGQGEFLFSATLTYAASLQVTSSTTTAVMGIGGTRTGIFTVF